MKDGAFVGSNRTAGLLVQEQLAIELGHVVKRARRVGCLRHPSTRVGIETNNGSADGELGEVPARDLVFHCGLLTRPSEKRCRIISFRVLPEQLSVTANVNRWRLSFRRARNLRLRSNSTILAALE